jgi:uncharacterized protein YdhG (YjbR/CyaY superfamily)
MAHAVVLPRTSFGPGLHGAAVCIVTGVSAVDEYFESLDPPTRAAFEHIRALVRDIAPQAEDGWSYGMAALRYKRRPLLGFRTAMDHLSIFPFSPKAVEVVCDKLTGYELSKGTIRFTLSKPLPDKVVLDVVRFRVEEIDASRARTSDVPPCIATVDPRRSPRPATAPAAAEARR